ncbi:MAG: tetraacyldisaccharide 4'-kinase, partial [Planctomycetota bacterium]
RRSSTWSSASRWPAASKASRRWRRPRPTRSRHWSRAVPVFTTAHTPVDVVEQPTGVVAPLASLAARRVVLLSGIARPASFRRTATELGAEVVADLRYRDHHRFTDTELAAAARTAAAAGATLVTTEKDDARMPTAGPPRLVVRIALRFLDGEPSPAELRL